MKYLDLNDDHPGFGRILLIRASLFCYRIGPIMPDILFWLLVVVLVAGLGYLWESTTCSLWGECFFANADLAHSLGIK